MTEVVISHPPETARGSFSGALKTPFPCFQHPAPKEYAWQNT